MNDWRDRQAARIAALGPVPPPSATRSAYGRDAPADVVLPVDQALRLGARPFDYNGTQYVTESTLPPPTGTPDYRAYMVRFVVPVDAEGVITSVAASCLVPWYNDEFTVELFIDNRPVLQSETVNQSIAAGTIQTRVAEPSTNLFEFVSGGQECRFIAAMGNAAGLGKLYPPTLGTSNAFMVRGRVLGRYWPKALRPTISFQG